jgi:hypothetical protein
MYVPVSAAVFTLFWMPGRLSYEPTIRENDQPKMKFLKFFTKHGCASQGDNMPGNKAIIKKLIYG